MKNNPAREALTRAVSRAIANGAPVYENVPVIYQAWIAAPHPDHGMTAPTWTRVGPIGTYDESRLAAEKEALRYFPRDDQAARRNVFLSRIVIKESVS